MLNKLQKLRWDKGWSQEYLARKSGVSRTTISRIENGSTSDPSISITLKIARALQVRAEDIFEL